MTYCDWSNSSEINKCYHDTEWGAPLHDDRKQFEFLMLEVLQCGLNWSLIMQKRSIFRQCFADFDYDIVASFGEKDIQRILDTEGMLRSRRKVEAVISNARCFQQVRKEFGTFSDYIWGFSKGKTLLYKGHADGWIPCSNGLSLRISQDLKKRGFKYVGAITIYSHLQACGIINDHSKHCPRYAEINSHHPTATKTPEHEDGVQFFG